MVILLKKSYERRFAEKENTVDNEIIENYNKKNKIFRAGCDSPPAVKVREPHGWPNRCNSDTDSKVWMGGDTYEKENHEY